jgi:HEPN domain-containing protein
MAPKRVPARREPPGSASLFLRKAEEFLRAALANLADRRWNAAALSAVHAAISAADASLVFAKGVRSTSQRHDEVADLVAGAVPGAAQALPHLRQILAKKHLVEYESRLFTESESRILVQHAERFLHWVRTHIGPTAGRR